VRFPNPDAQSIGLVTCESFHGVPGREEEYSVIFVPTTPNPTSGFLILANKRDLMPLDMSVEDAFKYVISCGMIMTPFKKMEGA